MKRCSLCGILKKEDDFYKHSGHRDGLTSGCKKCRSIKAKEYRLNNPKKVKEQQRKKYKKYKHKYLPKIYAQRQENPEKVKEITHRSYLKNKEKTLARNRKWDKEHKEEQNPKRHLAYINRYWTQKQMVYFFYSKGKMCCDLCKEGDMDILSIDHVDGGGVVARRNGENLNSFIKNNFPDGYRILCRNCNWREHLKSNNVLV